MPKPIAHHSTEWNVTFALHPASYDVAATAGMNLNDRAYDQQLTVDEMDTIVKHLKNLHICAIEQESGVNLRNM